MKNFNVAVVGATGAVGVEVLRLLSERNMPLGEVRALASERSAGKKLPFGSSDVTVSALNDAAFEGIDFAIFSAGASRSREFAPKAIEAGAVVIDNSSAYRLQDDIPLVVPEVNPGDLDHHNGLIANPNCCAAILAVALWPLHAKATIRRMIVSTYQSASGAGAQGIEELERQTRQWAAGEELTREKFPHPIALNLFSHDSAMEDNGFNGEENKVVAEMQKMFHAPNLGICVTCVRVPVPRAHSESVVIELESPLSAEEARELLANAPGVRVVDDAAANHFPMPLEASGELDVLVGRIRKDPSHPNALALFISGDQLLKGAAWNAVQITEALAERAG